MMQLPPNAIASELQLYLDAVARDGRAFEWAANNCSHFACRWVLRVTGIDPLAGLGVVADARAARALLRTLGDGTLRSAFGRCMGRAPMPPALAQLGDVVMVETGMCRPAGAQLTGVGGALGICAGRTGVFVDMQGAVGHVPMSAASVAWPLFERAAAEQAA